MALVVVLHIKRVVLGAQYRIPFFVWCALILVSCLAMVAIVIARKKYTAFFYSVSQVHGIIFACQTGVSRNLTIVSHVVEQAD